MLATFTPIAARFAFFSEEGGHEVHAGDGGALAQWAWLIVVVPMVITFLIVFFGKRSPLKGWGMATFGMAFVAVYAAVLAWKNLTEGILYEGAIEIGRIGDFTLEWGWIVDGLSIMMYFVVGVVGFLVFVYANGYMKGDVRYTWFFASFSLFAGGMLVLVSAPNLIQLIVGWELVGVSSYLLIAHYWEDMENVDAGNKAFMVNKVADAALFIGVIIMALSAGSFQFSEIFERMTEGQTLLAQFGFWAGLALFIGAMGKSAQFPFHVWLPDAMAGPTPVSALMHAATMVTAGIYLVARLFPFYQMPEFAGDASVYITVIGAITLFFMGLLALVQDDIKKVLAYSTVSQLGYMMAAMGVGAYTAGLFHLFTHAFFKSLLFLAAGSVIHAVHSNNMSDMGGLRKNMPATFWTFMIGTAALVGLFPFAGFWSKDEIIAAAYHNATSDPSAAAWFMVVLSIAGAFITAFYMARLVSLTFFGKYQGHASPHESPKIMTVPLVGLAFFAATAGLLNMPGLTEVFTDWVTVRAFPIIEHHATSPSWVLLAIVTPVVLVALAIGFSIFRPKDTQAERDTFRIPGLYPLLDHKYYIDDFYMDGIVRPTMGPIADGTLWIDQNVVDAVPNLTAGATMHLADAVNTVDQNVVDGVYNEAGAATDAAGGFLRKAFTGRVQQYAAMSFAGVVVIAALFMIF
ncbi:MAG: NADH-quinone oxidoreductase subunit L [Actinomycetota bacterium]|nr:NADH-quinone oxidoreductase subunit L [Actinomycetota bacterium]